MKFKVFNNISQLDDFAIEFAKKMKVSLKSRVKTLKKFGYNLTGELLIKAGSTTVDDKVIAKLIASGIIAIAASFSGGIGAGGASVITSEAITPTIEGILARLNEPEVKLGTKLKNKASNMSK